MQSSQTSSKEDHSDLLEEKAETELEPGRSVEPGLTAELNSEEPHKTGGKGWGSWSTGRLKGRRHRDLKGWSQLAVGNPLDSKVRPGEERG